MRSFKREDAGLRDQAALQSYLMGRAEALRRYVAMKIPPEFGPVVAAEDVLQEVWIAAFRGVSRFRATGPDAFDRWLVTIANRKLLDALKSARRLKRGGHARVFLGTAGRRSSLAGLIGCLSASQKTPSRDTSTRESARLVRSELSRLPEDRRRAIQMRYLEGYPPSEIAGKMHKSVSAVNSLLFRGLRELRARLGDAKRFFSDARSSDPVNGNG